MLPALDALITEGIEKEQCGTITSFYSSMRFIGVALGPPIFAYLMDKGDSIVFILSTICSLISLFLVLFFIQPDEEDESEQLKRFKYRKKMVFCHLFYKLTCKILIVKLMYSNIF